MKGAFRIILQNFLLVESVGLVLDESQPEGVNNKFGHLKDTKLRTESSKKSFNRFLPFLNQDTSCPMKTLVNCKTPFLTAVGDCARNLDGGFPLGCAKAVAGSVGIALPNCIPCALELVKILGEGKHEK